MAIGIGLAIALFFYVQGDIARDAQLRFNQRAADAKHLIEKRLRSYVSVTYGLRGLFAAKNAPSRADFHRYVESLNLKEDFPGFVQLNYARAIQAGTRNELEAEVRSDTSLTPNGYPHFTIKPPGDRPNHEVLIYIEPMEGNEFSFGLDIAASPERMQAQARGRDTGELVTSGRLVLAGLEGYVALSMRLPLYRYGAPLNTVQDRRASFIGTVGAGYNVRKLMTGVLDETTMTIMRYRLYDVGVAGAQRPANKKLNLLFDSVQTAPGAPLDDLAVLGPEPMFEAILPIEIAGRLWELRFSAPKEAFIERADALVPGLVLFGGLLLSALLFAVLYAFASSRERALTLAREITRELRESEANLEHAQAQAHLGSWTLNLATGEMSWSAETFRLLQLHPGFSVPGLDAFLLRMLEPDREAFKQATARCAESGSPCSIELPLTLPGGNPRWSHYVMQPLAGRAGTQLRGTIMDITGRKRALEAQRANAEQIRDLLRRLVTVQEAERRGLSANLHDLVGQSLTVLGIGLETLRSMLPGAARKSTEANFNELSQLLKDTMGSVRAVMSDLRPPLLDDYGLYAAIEWHARQFESRTGVPVDIEGAALDPRPAPEVELALFRIAQEALINVAKHAAASRARISITGIAGGARLLVEDDGRGPAHRNAANDPGSGGLGMAVMHERAAAVGGVMRVEHPGRGTRILVEVGGDPHYPG